jgi:alanyl-tRNA synthetase
MKELCSAVNAAVNGKGGGGPLFAQGKTERQVDAETLAMLKSYIVKAAD